MTICYCFDSSSAVLKKIASLSHPNSGRQMDVYTTAPAMQLYTANHLNPPFVPHQAVCLETQGYPDSPNHLNFLGHFNSGRGISYAYRI